MNGSLRIFGTGVGNRAGPPGARFPGCELRDRARGYRDSRDRAESHRTRSLGSTRFQPGFWKPDRSELKSGQPDSG